jgi:hypothetical protein
MKIERILFLSGSLRELDGKETPDLLREAWMLTYLAD